MSYYWFNRKEILQKSKERYSKEKAAEYYLKHKESQENVININKICFFLSIKRMSEKTLKFDNIRVNKKEFHKSKQPVDLMPVNVDQIVVSDKFKHSDEGFKYFIGYQEDEIVKPLYIILHEMIGYIKYFENGGKACLFLLGMIMC